MAPEKCILAAVDWSDESKHAFQWALRNVCRSDDKLVVLHVGHHVEAGFFTAQNVLTELQVKEEEGRRTLLEYYKSEAEKEKIPCKTMAVEGDARHETCKAVQKLKADVLCLGTRGRGAIKRAFLGSVSDHCLHNAECPVLVVRKPDKEAPAEARRKVVIAVDQSEYAEYSFRWACIELCRPEDQVITLHIRPPAYLRYPVAEMGMGEYYMPPDVIADMERASAEAAEDMVRKYVLQATEEYKLSCEGFVFRGEARDTLCTEAERLGANVLVLGSRGLGAVGRTVLGSVSDYVAHHAPCPVLVVKPARRKPPTADIEAGRADQRLSAS